MAKTTGDLTPLKKLQSKKWLYQCKCGNYVEAWNSNVGVGKRICCDDCKKGYRKSLIGQKFGDLIVVDYDKQSKKWLCQCKCGTKTLVKSNNLKSGNTTSCGKCGYLKSAKNKIVAGTNIAQYDKYDNGKVRKSNTSGYTGVYCNSNRNRWVAEINFRQKHYHLGTYIKKQDAINARLEAEQQLHGDFKTWYTNYKRQKQEGTK